MLVLLLLLMLVLSDLATLLLLLWLRRRLLRLLWLLQLLVGMWRLHDHLAARGHHHGRRRATPTTGRRTRGAPWPNDKRHGHHVVRHASADGVRLHASATRLLHRASAAHRHWDTVRHTPGRRRIAIARVLRAIGQASIAAAAAATATVVVVVLSLARASLLLLLLLLLRLLWGGHHQHGGIHARM